ncbi:phospholipid carrier-dependent glycosyltransferase [Candidatus Dojkabacteria bacterium]|nr:phospholipid carrier-dependent glycosyltransferase [Candidatus Dojkabacteria bacterium]
MSKNRNRVFTTLALSAMIILFVCEGLFHIGKFISLDERLWIVRVPEYIKSLARFDIEGAYISDKPGILQSILTGISYYGFRIGPKLLEFRGEEYAHIFAMWRFPILLFNALNLLPLFFLMSKFLRSRTRALVCILFIITTPILIGISQIVNPDSNLWITFAISLLSFYLALRKSEQSKKYLIISGVYLGLSLVSKYFGQFLYVCFIIVFGIEYLNSGSSNLQRNLSIMLKIVAIGIAIYILFVPFSLINHHILVSGALSNPLFGGRFRWLLITPIFVIIIDSYLMKAQIRKIVNKYDLYKHIISFVGGIILVTFLILILNHFKLIRVFRVFEYFTDKNKVSDWNHFEVYLGNFSNLLYALPIFTLLLFLYSILRSILLSEKKSEKGVTGSHLYKSESFLLIIFLYILGSSLAGLRGFARYQIVLFPLIIMFTISYLPSVNKISLINRSKLRKCAVILFVVFIQLSAVFRAAPFYYHYSNVLNYSGELPLLSTWGFGGYEVGQFMTSSLELKGNFFATQTGTCEFGEIDNIVRCEELLVDRLPYFPDPFCSENNVEFIQLNMFNAYRLENLTTDDIGFRSSIERYYFDIDPEIEYVLNGNETFHFKVVKIAEADKYPCSGFNEEHGWFFRED